MDSTQLEKHIKYLEDLLTSNKIKFEPFQQKENKSRQISKNGPYLFESNIQDRISYDDIERYKRQMILKEISLEGQVKLKNARVLVIGLGGIGGPAVLYLAGAGVGLIGMVDGDQVEISNLHRQIIHTTQRVGMNKCLSAQIQIQQFNPLVRVETYQFNLNPENAISLFSQYDIILDATDNPQTRYLINDACVILKRPLVSGAAVGWEAQLSIYNHNNGPCYRCLFPECPKGVKNCSDAGVFGVLPGVIGLLEALEAVKIILNQGVSLSQRMLIGDGLQGGFKVVKLRNKQKSCAVCGDQPTILDVSKYDYKTFAASCSVVIPPSTNYQNVSWDSMKQVIDDPNSVLLDCRPKEQHSILNFQKFNSIPWVDFEHLNDEEIEGNIKKDPERSIYIMCRSGNQSRLMCDFLFSKGYQNLHNIIGGINCYAKESDPDMPLLQ